MSVNNFTCAIVENDTVINVIVADNLEIAQELFPNNEVLDTTNEVHLVMFAFRENGKWFPKKPEPYINLETNIEEPYFWHEAEDRWRTQKEIDVYEEMIAQNITLPIVE